VDFPDPRKNEEIRVSRNQGQRSVDHFTKYFEGRVAKGEILTMPKITLIIARDNSQ
jgi:hypothetical protein